MSMRTVFWESNSLKMIDQRRLPAAFEVITLHKWPEVVEAIRNMTVRGAPAIGAAAAFGLVLAANESGAHDPPSFLADLESAAATLKATRPTAINLAWAVERVLNVLGKETAKKHALKMEDLRNLVLNESQRIADEDVATNKRMAEYGAKFIHDGDTILHHCNTGALAVVDWGTALGAIRTAHEQGKHINV
ncbi:MAG: S-methyl-5-thioribose-1-phosphate isomerase, partial [Anaerolineales bacterium]